MVALAPDLPAPQERACTLLIVVDWRRAGGETVGECVALGDGGDVLPRVHQSPPALATVTLPL
jgi:hypothetical protein